MGKSLHLSISVVTRFSILDNRRDSIDLDKKDETEFFFSCLSNLIRQTMNPLSHLAAITMLARIYEIVSSSFISSCIWHCSFYSKTKGNKRKSWWGKMKKDVDDDCDDSTDNNPKVGDCVHIHSSLIGSVYWRAIGKKYVLNNKGRFTKRYAGTF